jgi:hypothetical protein
MQAHSPLLAAGLAGDRDNQEADTIKPNPSREGDGKLRVLNDQDGRAAEGSILSSRPAYFVVKEERVE